MSHEGPPSRRTLAVAVLGGESNDVSISGLQLQSTDAELIGAEESLTHGLDRIHADCLLLVYRGFDERVEIPVDIAIPTYLLFDADGLTGYSRQAVGDRMPLEKGLALLRSLAPSVSLVVAPSDLAGDFLRNHCGFSRVVVAAEETAVADALGLAEVPAADDSDESGYLTLRVEGPFDSSYSLAVVNSGLALGLAGLSNVACGLDVAPGDQVAPAALSMRKNPTVAKMWTDGRRQGRVDAVIRNCYPPRPEDMNAKGRYLYFAWEDSLMPSEWAQRFNDNLTGVMAATTHVEKIFRDSGVTIPIAVVPHGLDEAAAAVGCVPYPVESSAGYKFLHIGSGFPRKGVDVLLDAYFAEFSVDDDVCLVLKSFPNIHNLTAEYLAGLQRENPNAPSVVHVERDLRPYRYWGLYGACDCFVSATRAEGFGLPMAEAMVIGLPVIVTDYSGHTDFCTDSTAFMVDSTLVESESHLAVPGAMWAEPSRASLSRHMRFVFENRDGAEVIGRVERASERVAQLTWHNAALAAVEFIRSTLGS